MTRLRPMREDEFPSFLAQWRKTYAEDLERNGGMAALAARSKAERDVDALLAGGLGSPGQTLRVLEDEEDEPVGRVWFSERERDGERVAFLFAIHVDEERRGRGLGRTGMRLLEEELRRRGVGRLELNVFGGNAAARRLYQSLGYAELSVLMGKELG